MSDTANPAVMRPVTVGRAPWECGRCLQADHADVNGNEKYVIQLHP